MPGGRRRPRGPAEPVTRPVALLLAPGAGADRNQSALVAIDAAVTALGVTVEPDGLSVPQGRPPGARPPARPAPRRCEEEAAALAARPVATGSSLWLGGRSMGGRMCSMAVADGLPAGVWC